MRHSNTLAVIGRVVTASTFCAVSLWGQPSAPTRNLVEEMRIVSNDSSVGTSLTDISAGTILSDGRIVTAHSREGTVRLFTAAGKFVSMIGSKGDGPGEYRAPNGLGMISDTLWVRDLGARRYVLFDASLKAVRTVQIGRGSGYYYGMASTTEGLFRGLRDSTHITVSNSNGEPVRQVPIVIRRARHQFTMRDPDAPGGTSVATSPLGVATDFDLLPGGKELLVLESWTLWGGKPGEVSIRRLALATGTLTPAVVVPLIPRPVTPRDADSILTVFTRNDSASVARSFRAGAKLPEYFPAYASWQILGPDLIWLRDPRVQGLRTVVTLAGELVMRVQLPRGLSVFAANRTHVWGSIPDSDGVPTIIRYRIQ